MNILEFDSEWFGKKIGRHDGHPEEADLWAKAAGLDCVFTLLPIEDIAQVYWASRNGFRLVDVKVEFSAKPQLIVAPTRVALPADWDGIKALARVAFKKTRFHNDGHFNRERIGEMYANWAATSAGATFVAETEGLLAGFVTVSDTHLELIAVDPKYRGQGFGHMLVHTALGYANAQGRKELRVVTQGGNHAAQRTFQASGFKLVQTSLWLHKWYE